MWHERLVRLIEDARWLDRPADAVVSALNSVLGPGTVKDALSGTWLGHAAHPMLVTVPIGAWVSTTWLDLVGGPGGRDAARSVVGFGTLAAVPAALSGTSDWADAAGAERRVGFVHAVANCAVLGLYAGSWATRRRGSHAQGAALAMLGAGVAGVSGWLGGHLTYATGLGVDTTAFLGAPQDWVDVGAVSDLRDRRPVSSAVGDVPLLLVSRDGEVHVLTDRCSHRGGPLHEGTVVDDCIECPWHGSRFRLADGSPARGPATRPQPAFEVRTEGDRILVRQAAEQRALRLNPVSAGDTAPGPPA